MLTIRVTCSKGTYVRVLGEDIGAELGCAILDIGLAGARPPLTTRKCHAPQRDRCLLTMV